MDIKPLISEFPFASELERQFVVQQLEQRELRISQVNYWGSIGFCIAAPLLTMNYSDYSSIHLTIMLTLHCLFLGLLFAAGRICYSKLSLKHWLLAINVSCLTYWYVFLATQEPMTSHFFWTYAGVVTMSTGFFGYLPFRNFIHITLGLYIIALCVNTVGRVELSHWFVVGPILAMMTSSNTQILIHRSFRYRVIREFRDKARYIPHQVIKRSMESKQPLASIYKAEERFTVCLSSDWRAFQQATRDMAPAEVGDMLAAWYGRMDELFQTYFPAGNFFYDWIADELFVVFFIDEQTEDKQRELVFDALRFADSLILMRPEFCTKYGVPQGLDVGLAAGNSVVGIFGPDGQAKATAFGEVPGLSRRIQTAGKILRAQHSDADRIVFNESIKSWRPDNIMYVEKLQLKPGLIKDLSETELYYCQPALPPAKAV